MRHDLIDVFYTYKIAFASGNEPLGTIKRNEADITLNSDQPYPQILRRPDNPTTPRAREALENNTQELIQLGVLKKVGNNEEAEVKTPFITSWHNDKSRIMGYFRAFNTYTIPDRYPIPIIQETLTQLSRSKHITSVDPFKGFNKNFLIPKAGELIRIITHCGIDEHLRITLGIKNAPSYHQGLMNTIFVSLRGNFIYPKVHKYKK
ncbi:hypothetical protein O181_092738 [Austropuccinia psidii MF-1]|uniref:Uncharacterized protein n=1 Tax=Austropuccinia psidii MF-1 TaxID=1389203 RepID=A0A9Q3P8Q4_9BASI|nr:hypothetical protein [Austropuccinia psidii MF-1]